MLGSSIQIAPNGVSADWFGEIRPDLSVIRSQIVLSGVAVFICGDAVIGGKNPLIQRIS